MNNTKIFEPQFNVYFSKLMYAVYEDIEQDWNGPQKYCELVYQNYQNLLLDKKSRSDGLKNRFTVSSEVKQYLTKLFMKMIEELNVVEIMDNDTIETISDHLESEIAESYTLFMWKVAAMHRCKFGETLKTAEDTTNWFKGKTIGFLPAYATRGNITNLIYNEFNAFLKALAWHIGKFNWYYEASISSPMFIGFLSQLGLEQIMIDELSGCVRPKAPPKAGAKTAKSATAATSPATPTTATPIEATTATAATVATAATATEPHQSVNDLGDLGELLI